jgi:hypothetical protein
MEAVVPQQLTADFLRVRRARVLGEIDSTVEKTMPVTGACSQIRYAQCVSLTFVNLHVAASLGGITGARCSDSAATVGRGL